MQNFTKILIDFKKIPRKKINRTFLDISGYPHYENVCSNILKFFFEIDNEHQLKDLFIKSLLNVSEIGIKNYPIKKSIVDREIKTEKENRLDILIETEEYIIGIENKIYHFLNNDLEDYAKTINNLAKIRRKEPVRIVLSLNKINDKVIEKNKFINVTYPDFFDEIQKNIGAYILQANNEYVSLLKQFITTINRLSGNNMKDNKLNTFFENNHETIEELLSEFNHYRNEIFNKVYQLEDIIDKSKYAPLAEKQWIYDKKCLVHDYKFCNKYKIAIDTIITLNGWEINIFGRDTASKNFLFNEILKDEKFANQNIDDYEIRNDRLIFYHCKPNEIEKVTNKLIEMLSEIEKKKETYKCEN